MTSAGARYNEDSLALFHKFALSRARPRHISDGDLGLGYLPKLRIEKISRRKAEIVIEPMFPRYVFVRLDLVGQGKSWEPVRSTVGMLQLIYFGNRAAQVDDALIDWLRRREARASHRGDVQAGRGSRHHRWPVCWDRGHLPDGRRRPARNDPAGDPEQTSAHANRQWGPAQGGLGLE